jgi:hypothetical protein
MRRIVSGVTCTKSCYEGVDARHKAGHDEGILNVVPDR